MSRLNPEDIKTLVQALQTPQPAAGAVTANGLVKYQTIIIFMIMSAVGVGGWLVNNAVSGTSVMVSMKNDIDNLKRAQEAIGQIKADQTKTSGEVRELQIAVNSINVSIKDMSTKFEAMSGDMRAVSQQVSAISQSLRGRQ